MTDEQMKYRAGQTATVRVLIRNDGPDADGEVLIRRNAPGEWGSIWIPAADIVSVEPGPLEVGNRVKSPAGNLGEIGYISRDGHWATVEREDGYSSHFPINTLVRA